MKTDSSKATLALLATLRKVCARLPAAEEYVMVHHPAFRVGKKPFAIAGMEEATKGATLSINLGPDAQLELLDDARFTRTPYIGQHGWVTITQRKLKKGELETLVTESFRRVANKTQLALLGGARPKSAPDERRANDLSGEAAEAAVDLAECGHALLISRRTSKRRSHVAKYLAHPVTLNPTACGSGCTHNDYWLTTRGTEEQGSASTLRIESERRVCGGRCG